MSRSKGSGILPFMQATKLACQSHGCRQKTLNAWVRDKGQFPIHRNRNRQSYIICAGLPSPDSHRARSRGPDGCGACAGSHHKSRTPSLGNLSTSQGSQCTPVQALTWTETLFSLSWAENRSVLCSIQRSLLLPSRLFTT